jgi:hypothetical protein
MKCADSMREIVEAEKQKLILAGKNKKTYEQKSG